MENIRMESKMTDKRMYRVLMPCLMGMEALVKAEAIKAGYSQEALCAEDAQVAILCRGLDAAKEAVARMNFHSRFSERVLLELGNIPAADYNELFEGTRSLPWEAWIKPAFPIVMKSGSSRRSQIYGIPSCQRIIKKALVQRLLEQSGLSGGIWPEEPSKTPYVLQFSLCDDICSIALDTTGAALHKRSYRPAQVAAPLKETLAAAILELSLFPREFHYGERLWDPCCGSGTFGIEAALMLKDVAPGLQRHFSGEKNPLIGASVFDREREIAKRSIHEVEGPIALLSDIDPHAVDIARQNARRAGVESLFMFEVADLRRSRVQSVQKKLGEKILIVANPPYGERLSDEKDAGQILKALGQLAFERGKLREGVRLSFLSPDKEAERQIGAKASKRRKLYNGGIPCTMYHYFRLPTKKKTQR